VEFDITNRLSVFVALAGLLLLLAEMTPVIALEPYPPSVTRSFMDWCTGTKGTAEGVCSCTLKNLAQTVPAMAISRFVGSEASFSLSAMAVSTGSTVTDALLRCSKA